MNPLRKLYRCKNPALLSANMHRWFSTELAQGLLEQEQTLLNRYLPNLFGYYLLQLGGERCGPLCSESRIRHRVHAHCSPMPTHCEDEEASVLQVDPLHLPLDTDSVDVLLYPHILEYSPHPHELLREADRILIPEGHIIITGFNPWSLWGLWRLLAGWRGKVPWCGHYYSIFRIRDWLALLGFDIVAVRQTHFRPPLQSARIMQKLYFLERWGRRLWPIFGGSYIVVAKKRVSTLTPIKPRWRPQRSLAGKLAEPSLKTQRRNSHHE